MDDDYVEVEAEVVGGDAGEGNEDGSLSQGMATADRATDEERRDEQEDEEDGEEGRKGKGLPSPPIVSRKEREEHELTHLPYRSWCPQCVRARGRNQPHSKLKGQHGASAAP